MQLGFVGLGKMGLNMVTRLARRGHEIVAFDCSPDAVMQAEAAGARGGAALAPQRAMWVMVPSGAPTESTVASLRELLAAGGAIIESTKPGRRAEPEGA